MDFRALDGPTVGVSSIWSSCFLWSVRAHGDAWYEKTEKESRRRRHRLKPRCTFEHLLQPKTWRGVSRVSLAPLEECPVWLVVAGGDLYKNSDSALRASGAQACEVLLPS